MNNKKYIIDHAGRYSLIIISFKRVKIYRLKERKVVGCILIVFQDCFFFSTNEHGDDYDNCGGGDVMVIMVVVMLW